MLPRAVQPNHAAAARRSLSTAVPWTVKRTSAVGPSSRVSSHWAGSSRRARQRAAGVKAVDATTSPAGRRSNHAQSIALNNDLTCDATMLFSQPRREEATTGETIKKLADLQRMLSFEASERFDEVSPAAEPAARLSPSDERRVFLDMYGGLAADVSADVEAMGLPAHSRRWIDEMFEYTIQGGKMTRGMMVPQVVLGLGSASEEVVRQARVVGWCIEVLQAAFLTVDDVLDQADMRRGKPAYYRLPHVGMTAINDGLLLESLTFRLMRQHVRSHPSYLELTELFRESIFVTECGQLMDLTAPPVTIQDLEERFTLTEYAKMVQCKTSHYTFYLPVAAGLHLAGAASDATLREARAVCDAIGEYFQVQDDFLDCFGAAEETGKGNTDIAERKCSWLAVTALGLCAEDASMKVELQTALMAGDTARVTEIYEQLGVRDAYAEYEQDSVAAIWARLSGCAELAPARPILEGVVGKLFQRRV